MGISWICRAKFQFIDIINIERYIAVISIKVAAFSFFIFIYILETGKIKTLPHPVKWGKNGM